MTSPVFAAAPATMSQERQDVLYAELRGMVENNVVGLLSGLVGSDDVKGLIKGFIGDYLNFENIAGASGELLGGLIENAIRDYIGIDIPDSINIGGIINDVANNEIVYAILTSEFLEKVFDRIIDNLIDAIEIEEVLSVLLSDLVENVTNGIWNDGRPTNYSVVFGITVGSWDNTNERWVEAGVNTAIYTRLLGQGLIGLISSGFDFDALLTSFVDIDNIDFMDLLPSMDVILNAVWKAITDTTLEYYEDFRGQIIAEVGARIEAAKEMAQDQIEAAKERALIKIAAAREAAMIAFIDELNFMFGAGLTVDMECEEILIHLYTVLEGRTLDNKDNVIRKLNVMRKIAAITGRDEIVGLLNKLIACIEEKADNRNKKSLVNVTSNAKQFVSIMETSKNSRVWTLTFDVNKTYSDGTAEVVRYSVNLNGNNANQDGKLKFSADHDLSGYTLIYDIKGNGSNIKDFRVVKN